MPNIASRNGRGQPELLTVQDVQTITQLGRTKVYELIRDGELPVLRIGRSLRIRREVLEAWLFAQEDNVLLFERD